MAMLGIASATMLSPGTHSKWARLEAGRLTGFATTMSGEFYALLREHSILARSLPDDDGALDGAAFDAGVRRSLDGAGLMQSAFSVRSLDLFARMPRAGLPSYLSGLVLGEAVRAPALDGETSVVVIGAPALTERFAPGGFGPPNTATLTFTTPLNYISFLWGSPDTYNTLTVNSTGGGSQTFTATGVGFGTAFPVTNGDQAFMQAVQFQGLSGSLITSLVFNSTVDSFEAAHFTAQVPEPETYGLMLAGLGAIGFMSRRRRKTN